MRNRAYFRLRTVSERLEASKPEIYTVIFVWHHTELPTTIQKKICYIILWSRSEHSRLIFGSENVIFGFERLIRRETDDNPLGARVIKDILGVKTIDFCCAGWSDGSEKFRIDNTCEYYKYRTYGAEPSTLE